MAELIRRLLNLTPVGAGLYIASDVVDALQGQGERTAALRKGWNPDALSVPPPAEPTPPEVITAWVTTKDGQTIKGVVVASGPDIMVLRAAQLGSMNQQLHRVQWTKMQGEVVINVENVAYWQRSYDLAFLDLNEEE